MIKKINWSSVKSAIITPKFTVRNVLLSLVIGILLGYLTLGITYGFGEADKILKALFLADFQNTLEHGATYLLNKIVVLGFAGLAVAVALKSKILNIGVSGQMTFGALIGYLVLNSFHGNEASTFFIGILFAIIGAVTLSTFMGALKVYFKVNEVVVAIMLNWIVVFLAKWLETNATIGAVTLNETLRANADHMIMYTSIIIVLFVVSALATWYIFKRTSIGFKIEASGENKYAAEYSGYKQNINNLIIFAWSGLFAGLAGFSLYYVSLDWISTEQAPISYGFTGIAVSLVGMNNAAGVVASAVLFGVIDGPFSGLIIQGYKNEVVQIFSSVVTYFVAIVSLWQIFKPIQLTKNTWNKFHGKKTRKAVAK